VVASKRCCFAERYCSRVVPGFSGQAPRAIARPVSFQSIKHPAPDPTRTLEDCTGKAQVPTCEAHSICPHELLPKDHDPILNRPGPTDCDRRGFPQNFKAGSPRSEAMSFKTESVWMHVGVRVVVQDGQLTGDREDDISVFCTTDIQRSANRLENLLAAVDHRSLLDTVGQE
jgi:hypothetical protein